MSCSRNAATHSPPTVSSHQMVQVEKLVKWKHAAEEDNHAGLPPLCLPALSPLSLSCTLPGWKFLFPAPIALSPRFQHCVIRSSSQLLFLAKTCPPGFRFR